MDNNKLLARNTIVLNLRLVISLIISLYTSSVILKVLGEQDYGLYTLVGGFVMLLSIFTSSITGAAQRFITYELGVGDKDKLRQTFSTIVTVLILLSLVIGLIGGILGSWFVTTYLNIPAERIDAALFVYAFSILVFILNLLSVPYVAVVTAHEHMNFFAVMSLFDAFGKLILVILLQYIAGDHLYEYAVGLALVSLTSRIIYGIYCSKHFEETKFRFSLDKKVLKGVFSFSVWMGIGSACGILKDQSGSILINMFFGLVLNAAIGIANQVKGLVFAFYNSIGMAISPQITKSYANGNLNRAFHLTFLMAKCQGVFMSLIAVPLFIEMQYLLTIWLGKYPDYTIEFSRIIIFVTFLNSLSMGFGPLFLAIGRIRNYQLVSSCITILYIPICYLLLKLFNDPMICFFVSIAMEGILLITNYICLKIQVNFPLMKFYKVVILPIIVTMGIVTISLYYVIPSICEPSFCRLMFTSALSTIILGTLVYIFVLTKEERTACTQYLQKKLCKNGRSSHI